MIVIALMGALGLASAFDISLASSITATSADSAAYFHFNFFRALVVSAVVFALCMAITYGTTESDRPRPWREAVGVLRFNACLTAIAVFVMLIARLDVIHADIQAAGAAAKTHVQEFLAPVPTLPKSTQ